MTDDPRKFTDAAAARETADELRMLMRAPELWRAVAGVLDNSSDYGVTRSGFVTDWGCFPRLTRGPLHVDQHDIGGRIYYRARICNLSGWSDEFQSPQEAVDHLKARLDKAGADL